MSQVTFEGWREVPGSGTSLVSHVATAFNGTLYLFGIGINDHAHYVTAFDGVG